MRITRFARLSLLLALLTAVGSVSRPALADQPNTLTPAELDDGWILLFDGETLYGWRVAGDADWHVADGVIRATKGTPGLLHTSSQWGNFELKADFRIESGGNSGIFVRTSPEPPPTPGRYYEFNIADADGEEWPTGSLVHHKKADAPRNGDDWRAMHITADGGRFAVRIDGAEVLQYDDPKPAGRGYIGLQFRSGAVEFRNVKLKPLGLKSLFNGKDLTGWRLHEEKSKASVTPEGWLHLKDGPGTLETEDQWADFTMQMEVFVNGKELNSGVFFRSIPRERWNGYESQIHNGYTDGDRTRPRDAGTGGIFRRQDARKVVANDFEWFSKTIHVADRHMAVWVNGYQVSDWTDRREPDPNPRRGLRLEAGTIQIQGHDPETDLSFRNIGIVEIPAR
ncbi:MAG: DUF1080 domain-containing protein [Thermoguttaceae bacterium]|jgi:hypothetical protein|nr:DUF1080 domain-containing protein [Thermoguttaceae bacterium]